MPEAQKQRVLQCLPRPDVSCAIEDLEQQEAENSKHKKGFEAPLAHQVMLILQVCGSMTTGPL